MDYGIKGQTVLIIGGARGIGYAAAKLLASDGCNVAIADINGDAAKASAQKLAASSGAIVDGLGGNWMLFFVLTTVMVTPALLILLWVGKLLGAYNVGGGTGQGGDPNQPA